MRFFGLKLAVPIAGLAICLLGMEARGQAPGQMPGQMPAHGIYYQGAGQAAAAAAAFQEVGSTDAVIGGCSDCGTGGLCDGGCGMGDGCGCGDGCDTGVAALTGGFSAMGARAGQIYAGADFLNVRANFSEALAYVERDIPVEDTYHQLGFDYDQSYRLYGGYRFLDCCGDVQFTFTRFTSNAEQGASPDGIGVEIVAPYEVLALNQQDSVRVRSGVEANSFDLDFARTIPLGSPLDECGCDCCWCPAWDIRWYAGVRYADVSWYRNSYSNVPSTDVADNRSSQVNLDFHGIGPRIGAEGRRYFGRKGLVSLFAKGTVSLLLGDVDYQVFQAREDGLDGPLRRARFRRVVPVTDIEVGGTVHIGCHASISTGYLLSTWHDLGMGDEYEFNLCSRVSTTPISLVSMVSLCVPRLPTSNCQLTPRRFTSCSRPGAQDCGKSRSQPGPALADFRRLEKAGYPEWQIKVDADRKNMVQVGLVPRGPTRRLDRSVPIGWHRTSNPPRPATVYQEGMASENGKPRPHGNHLRSRGEARRSHPPNRSLKRSDRSRARRILSTSTLDR